MTNKGKAILEYLYKHKTENGLNSAVLIELPNTDGINDIYGNGYVALDFNKDRSIKKVTITGKGIDWVKANNLSDRDKILQYCYDHRFETGVATSGLDSEVGVSNHDILLTETEYLVQKGLLESRQKVLSGDMVIKITANGIDKVENGKQIEALESVLSLPIKTDVSITSDVISVKIRPEIYDHIKSFLDSGHSFTAVEEAYKVVRDKLKNITGEEAAAAVFGENALNNKYWETIFGSVPNIGTTEADFMRGAGYLHLGVQYLRNEKTHTTATSLDKNLALHYISLASLAYDLITRTDEAGAE
jgi:uncharacterized protein (TIGR02391 family)